MIPKSVVDKAERLLEERAIRSFKAIGEAAVSEAFNNGSYQDRSGNLRSSVGYVVALNGVVREEGGFHRVGNGDDGMTIGRDVAYERAEKTEGLALVLVAGMKYAEYVSDLGYNVLDSAESLALKLCRQLEK